MDVGEEIKKESIKLVIGIPVTVTVLVIGLVSQNYVEWSLGLFFISLSFNVYFIMVYLTERNRSSKLEKASQEQTTKTSELERNNLELSKQVEEKTQLENDIKFLQNKRIEDYINSDFDPYFETVEDVTVELDNHGINHNQSWRHHLPDKMNDGDRIRIVVAGNGEFEVIIAKFLKNDDGIFTQEKICKPSGKVFEWKSTCPIDNSGYYGVLLTCRGERVKFRINVKIAKKIDHEDMNSFHRERIPTMSGGYI
jgi:hypothetical protein